MRVLGVFTQPRPGAIPYCRGMRQEPRADFGQDTSSRFDDASKRMAGLPCGGPHAFSLLSRNIHRKTAGDCAALVMYLKHDPHG